MISLTLNVWTILDVLDVLNNPAAIDLLFEGDLITSITLYALGSVENSTSLFSTLLGAKGLFKRTSLFPVGCQEHG